MRRRIPLQRCKSRGQGREKVSVRSQPAMGLDESLDRATGRRHPLFVVEGFWWQMFDSVASCRQRTRHSVKGDRNDPPLERGRVPGPHGSPSVRGVDRRTLLRGALGVGTLLGAGGLAACASGSTGSTGVPTGAVTGTVTVGSNQSDAVPKAAVQSYMDAFAKANPGTTVKINTVDHNSFQENINNYLQGSPDDVFTWFAGYRMQFFAEKGLVGDISDVWKNITGMSDALKKASTAADGKQYFVPITNYPWAVFYRKSLFQEKGYEVPKTLDDLNALGAQMKKDGLAPIAFGDKDGWPAMGTFDQINLRVNGYDFHVSLMAGKESWTDPKVKKVFDTWAGILPSTRPTPSVARGRRPRSRSSRRSPACTSSAPSSPSSSPRAPSRTTSTSSPSRRSTRRSAPTPSRPRSTAT